MKADTRGLSRRSFLLAVGAGSAATAAAHLATRKPTESSQSGKGKRATRGYHASEHINTYYRTTKV